MTKYLITILVFIAILAGLLLWVGDDATLMLTSTAQTGPFAHPPIELTWQAVILLCAAFTLGIIALWSILLWFWRLPRRLKSGVGMRKRNRAIDAMEDALIAGAEGNIDRARKASARVRELAGSTDLGHIISATAAEACGDREEAALHYEAMLDSAKTRPTGQRGIAQTKLATGDIPGAIEAAQDAFDTNPRARWAFDTLFKALVSDFRWADAREALEKGRAAKHLSGDVYRRRKSVLLTAEADWWMDNGQHDKAEELALAALKEAADFAPAAAIAAHELARHGGQKKAAKLLEEAWAKAPHPALSVAYLDLYPGEADKTRSKRVEKFASLAPNHRETKLLLIEDRLQSGAPVDALAALTPMLDAEEPTARLCLLAAEAERALGNEVDARMWTERAAIAPHERDWSDLDPKGPGFDYTPQDWRRLVFSFGDSGELEHPRAERLEAVRRPVTTSVAQERELERDEKVEKSTDDLKSSMVEDTDDLANRLDQLLDAPKSAD
ncbi:MAG: heme biosynthesis HemY N-terminal domain-containing protein [Pseudomonadota bacterium]